MTDLRKAAEIALDALRKMTPWLHPEEKAIMKNVIEALRQALAQPEQEPVAWMYVNEDGECEQIEYGVSTVEAPYITLLYTAPPSKPDVNQELVEALQECERYGGGYTNCEESYLPPTVRAKVQAALAKYKEQAK